MAGLRRVSVLPVPSPRALLEDGTLGDSLYDTTPNLPFDTPVAAVRALDICKEECDAKKELGKLALLPTPGCRQSQLHGANRLMYHLRRSFADPAFVDDFVHAGGPNALLAYIQTAEGGAEAEALKTLRDLCCTAGVTQCGGIGCLAQLHSVIMQMSRAEEHIWGRSVTHALEALSEIVYRSPPQVADRVHRVFLSSGSHYCCVGDVLRRASTRLLHLTANVACFLLLLCTSATRACAKKMLSLWKAAQLTTVLLGILDVVGDDATKALIHLLLFTMGCPARVSQLPLGGCEVGEFTRFLYRGKGRFAAQDPTAEAASHGDDEEVCEEFLHAVKEVAFNALPGAALHNGTLQSVSAFETLSRWRSTRVQDETRELIKISCVSNEIAFLERQLPGTLRIDDSNLQAPTQIGKGSFGQVYRATHALTREPVAVKYLKTAAEKESKLKGLKRNRAFLREALLLHRLRNNSIVNFYGWAKSDDDTATGGMWLVTEYCPGGTLAALVHHKPQLTPEQRGEIARSVGLSIASALSYIHSTTPRMVHMDVAARNVLVATNGAFKLGDVGSLRYAGERDLQLCVPWSPPEALRKGYAAHPAHDVWAFGCLLYEVLEGDIPFHDLHADVTDDVSFVDLVRAEIADEVIPAPPYAVAAEDSVAQDLWDGVISPCWSFDRAARPQIVDMLLTLTSMTNEPPRSVSSVPLDPSAPPAEYDPSTYQPYEGFSSDLYGQSVSSGLATSRLEREVSSGGMRERPRAKPSPAQLSF